MKRFALPILLLVLAAAGAAIFLALSRPDAQASPDATITVNDTADTDVPDGALTLREAILLATGVLDVGTLTAAECGQVSNSTYGPPCSTTDTVGAASTDTIVFDPAVFNPGTIILSSTLPVLSTGYDTVDGSSAGVAVYGDDGSFNCFEITSSTNTIRGLEVYQCDRAIYLHSGATSNTIGGAVAADRNVLSGGGWGVVLTNSGTTGNLIIGNYIGTNADGDAAIPNFSGVTLSLGAAGNTIGGPSPGEGNVISGSFWAGVNLQGDDVTANVVEGNYIGLNASRTAAVPNAAGIIMINGSHDNTVRGNVISGNQQSGVDVGGLPYYLMGSWGPGPQDIAVDDQLEVQLNGETIFLSSTLTGFLGPIPLRANLGDTVRLIASSTIDDCGSIGTVDLFHLWTYETTDLTEGVDNGCSGTGVFFDETYVVGIPVTAIGPASGNIIQGNLIGTDYTATTPIPNGGHGVLIRPGGQGSTIGGTGVGEDNLIAYNAGDGIRVRGSDDTDNAIRGNSIHSNAGKGIENIDGGNTELTPPVVDSVGASVSGHTDPKCFPCTVDIFSDDQDEGRVYHGSAATNDDPTGTWTYAGAVTGPNVTATVTDASDNTSEFSLYDTDGDGVGNGYPHPIDNCPDVHNPDQENWDQDDEGDICDDDRDGDGWLDDEEAVIGTAPLDSCTDRPGDADAWPPDNCGPTGCGTSDTKADILDVSCYKSKIGYCESEGGYDPRYNLEFTAAAGCEPPEQGINILDVLLYKPVLGTSCQCLTLGTLLPYTGALADFGPPSRNAADLAAVHVDAAEGILGKNLKLVHRDSATDPNTAVSEAQSLVDIHEATAVIGALASGVTRQVAEQVTIPSQVVLISPASTSPLITDLLDDDYVFRTIPSDASQGAVLAALAQEQGFTKAATMYIDDPYGYGQGLSDAFAAEFTSLGGEVTATVPHQFGQETYVPQLEEAVADDPDVLVAISWPEEAKVYLAEAIDNTLIDTFLFSDGVKSQEVIDAVGAEALQGTYCTTLGAMETAGSATFDAAYEAEYGEPPPADFMPYVRTPYDAVILAALAAEKAESPDPTAIRDALRDVANPPGVEVGPGAAGIADALALVRSEQDIDYEGASGPVNLDANGDVTCGAIEVWIIESGAFVSVRVDIVGTC